MITAAGRPEPATSPITTPSSPGRQGEHVVPVAAHHARAGDIAGGHLRAPRRPGSADGSRLRCSASAATRSSWAVSECTAVAARSAASCSSSTSSLVNSRRRQRPDMQHADHPAAGDQRHAHQGAGSPSPTGSGSAPWCDRRGRGSPAGARRRSARRTRGRPGSARPGAPLPPARRPPSRSAAREEKSSSSTAAVSACRMALVRSSSSASSSWSSSRDRAASVIDWISRSLSSSSGAG